MEQFAVRAHAVEEGFGFLATGAAVVLARQDQDRDVDVCLAPLVEIPGELLEPMICIIRISEPVVR